tara:strand:+ start:2809 stop:3081 length:273 start_codon:yes stop_codon:yes gene_type:complete
VVDDAFVAASIIIIIIFIFIVGVQFIRVAHFLSFIIIITSYKGDKKKGTPTNTTRRTNKARFDSWSFFLRSRRDEPTKKKKRKEKREEDI